MNIPYQRGHANTRHALFWLVLNQFLRKRLGELDVNLMVPIENDLR